MIISVNYQLDGSLFYEGCGVDELTWSYTAATKQRYNSATINDLSSAIDSILTRYERRLSSRGLAIINFQKRTMTLIGDKTISSIKIDIF
jgi:hypothetical protein